ncbi:transposase [mine drainage metagenome]|uniref:Transposase n=1 Tax=mine drainage metagenome TaxID=410659 RepID=T0Z0Y6_9ZZZZ
MDPVLNKALAGQGQVYFVDASHFVYGPFLTMVWCFCRTFIKTPSGRQRLNVLGAINAVSRHFVSVINQTYITAQTVCELLDKLRTLHPSDPLTLVLDNARYQHCKLVVACAAARGITLLFLPPYSPNLNLIERLWKFIKKDCLNGRYYPTHQQFQAAILKSLDAINTHHGEALKTTLTLNFQMFDNVQLLAA